MYSNIGGKIKGLAKFIAGMGVFCGVVWLIWSIVAYTDNTEYIKYADLLSAYEYPVLYEAGMEGLAGKEGIKWSIITIIASFISSWPMYGFGQLIENTDKLVAMNQTKPEEKKSIEDELPMI